MSSRLHFPSFMQTAPDSHDTVPRPSDASACFYVVTRRQEKEQRTAGPDRWKGVNTNVPAASTTGFMRDWSALCLVASQSFKDRITFSKTLSVNERSSVRPTRISRCTYITGTEGASLVDSDIVTTVPGVEKDVRHVRSRDHCKPGRKWSLAS